MFALAFVFIFEFAFAFAFAFALAFALVFALVFAFTFTFTFTFAFAFAFTFSFAFAFLALAELCASPPTKRGVPAATFACNASAARLHRSIMRWQSAKPCMVKLALVR